MLGDDYILYPAGWHTLRPLGVGHRMQDTLAPAADLSPPAQSVAEDDAYGGWEDLK